MKEEIIQTLLELKESNSWDLAWQLAEALSMQDEVDVNLLDAIIHFLDLTIKSSNLKENTDKLIKARDFIIEIRNREFKEREQEIIEIEKYINIYLNKI